MTLSPRAGASLRRLHVIDSEGHGHTLDAGKARYPVLVNGDLGVIQRLRFSEVDMGDAAIDSNTHYSGGPH